MKLSELVSNFLSFCKIECYYSASTVVAYKTDLKQFLNFCHSPSLTKDYVTSYFNGVLNSHYSDKTKSRKISTIRSFFSYLINESKCSADCLNWVPDYKVSYRLLNVVDKDHINQLINLPDKSTLNGFRDYLLLELLYSTGIRVSECVNLKYSDVNIALGTIKVSGKGSKQRIIPLTKSLQSTFDQLKIESMSYYIFSNSEKPITRQAVFYTVKKYLNQLSSADISLSPHSFRHAFASHILEGGARLRDVQLLLGHSNISSTQNYLKLTDSYRKKMFLQAHPRGVN